MFRNYTSDITTLPRGQWVKGHMHQSVFKITSKTWACWTNPNFASQGLRSGTYFEDWSLGHWDFNSTQEGHAEYHSQSKVSHLQGQLQLPWWPQLTLLSWCPVFKSSFEDQLQIVDQWSTRISPNPNCKNANDLCDLQCYWNMVAKCDPWIHRATQCPTIDGTFGDQWIL